MALQTNSEYKISEQGFQAVKKICSNINDEQSRKRAFKALLCLDVLADALDAEGYKVDISKNLYKILPINEEFEFTDIHYNGRFIDVLPVVNEKYVLVPKIHFEYGIVPDMYVVAEYRDKNVRFFGCIDSSNLDKNNQNDKYYIMETTQLLPLDKLEEVLNNPKKVKVTDKSHAAFAPYFINYIDGTLNDNNKQRLITHLIECKECRDKFVEFFDYEIIAKVSAKYPDIMEDHTLDIVGAAAVNDEKYKDFEEITLEIDKEPDEYDEYDEDEDELPNKNIRPAIDDPLQVLYGTGNHKKTFKDIVTPKSKSILGDIIKDFEKEKEDIDEKTAIIEKKESINPEYYQEDLSDGLDVNDTDVSEQMVSATEIINGDIEDDPVVEEKAPEIIIDTDKIYKENIEEIIPAKKDVEMNDDLNEDKLVHFDAEDVDLIDDTESFVMNAAEEATFTNSQLEDMSNSVVADFIDNNINDKTDIAENNISDDDYIVSSDFNKKIKNNDVLALDDAVNTETIEDDSEDVIDLSNMSDDDFFVSNTIEKDSGGEEEDTLILSDDSETVEDDMEEDLALSDANDDDFFVSNTIEKTSVDDNEEDVLIIDDENQQENIDIDDELVLEDTETVEEPEETDVDDEIININDMTEEDFLVTDTESSETEDDELVLEDTETVKEPEETDVDDEIINIDDMTEEDFLVTDTAPSETEDDELVLEDTETVEEPEETDIDDEIINIDDMTEEDFLVTDTASSETEDDELVLEEESVISDISDDSDMLLIDDESIDEIIEDKENVDIEDTDGLLLDGANETKAENEETLLSDDLTVDTLESVIDIDDSGKELDLLPVDEEATFGNFAEDNAEGNEDVLAFEEDKEDLSVEDNFDDIFSIPSAEDESLLNFKEETVTGNLSEIDVSEDDSLLYYDGEEITLKADNNMVVSDAHQYDNGDFELEFAEERPAPKEMTDNNLDDLNELILLDDEEAPKQEEKQDTEFDFVRPAGASFFDDIPENNKNNEDENENEDNDLVIIGEEEPQETQPVHNENISLNNNDEAIYVKDEDMEISSSAHGNAEREEVLNDTNEKYSDDTYENSGVTNSVEDEYADDVYESSDITNSVEEEYADDVYKTSDIISSVEDEYTDEEIKMPVNKARKTAASLKADRKIANNVSSVKKKANYSKNKKNNKYQEEEQTSSNKKNVIIISAIIGVVVLLAGIGIAAKMAMSNNSNENTQIGQMYNDNNGEMNENNQDGNPEDYQNGENNEQWQEGENGNPEDNQDNNEEGLSIPENNPAPFTPKAGTENAMTEDMNKAVTNAFSDTPSSMLIRKVSWGVNSVVINDEQIRPYLQETGKNIQSALNNNIRNVKVNVPENKAKVQIKIAEDGQIQDFAITKSSGSEEVDSIVLQSVKDVVCSAPALRLSEETINANEQATGERNIVISVTVLF